MKFYIENHLPFVALTVSYQGKTIVLPKVLVDTGCAATILDTDALKEIDLNISMGGRIVRMYGVGGEPERCFEHETDITIDNNFLPSFTLQLGLMRDVYGFDGFLGTDYLLSTGAIIDYKIQEIRFE